MGRLQTLLSVHRVSSLGFIISICRSFSSLFCSWRSLSLSLLSSLLLLFSSSHTSTQRRLSSSAFLVNSATSSSLNPAFRTTVFFRSICRNFFALFSTLSASLWLRGVFPGDLGVPRPYFRPPELGVLDFPEDFRLPLCGVFFPLLALPPPADDEVSREEGRDLLEGVGPLGERKASRLACDRERLREEREEGEGLGMASAGRDDSPKSKFLTYASCK